jgi:hypothetical protein
MLAGELPECRGNIVLYGRAKKSLYRDFGYQECIFFTYKILDDKTFRILYNTVILK